MTPGDWYVRGERRQCGEGREMIGEDGHAELSFLAPRKQKKYSYIITVVNRLLLSLAFTG
jgi:hypothetical protein